MRLHRIVLTLVVAFIASCSSIQKSQSQSQSQSQDLPAAPNGFTWYESKNDNGTFLLPQGWFVKETSSDTTSSLYISKENIEIEGRYITGLSVLKRSLHKIKQVAPSKYAEIIASKVSNGKDVLISKVIKGNANDMHVVRVKGNNSGVPTIVHYITIGFDDRGEAYFITFEAPEVEWSKSMEIGRPMLNYFIL